MPTSCSLYLPNYYADLKAGWMFSYNLAKSHLFYVPNYSSKNEQAHTCQVALDDGLDPQWTQLLNTWLCADSSVDNKTGGWYKHGNNCSLIRGIFQQVRAMPHVKDKSIICGRACLYGLMQMAISVGTATLLIDWCAGYPGWPSPALPIFTRWLLNVGLCAS